MRNWHSNQHNNKNNQNPSSNYNHNKFENGNYSNNNNAKNNKAADALKTMFNIKKSNQYLNYLNLDKTYANKSNTNCEQIQNNNKAFNKATENNNSNQLPDYLNHDNDVPLEKAISDIDKQHNRIMDDEKERSNSYQNNALQNQYYSDCNKGSNKETIEKPTFNQNGVHTNGMIVDKIKMNNTIGNGVDVVVLDNDDNEEGTVDGELLTIFPKLYKNHRVSSTIADSDLINDRHHADIGT
jgi:hypothetical protein